YDAAANAGRGRPADSMLMPGARCYESEAKLMPKPAGDVNKARSILLGAGYSVGPDGILQKDGKRLTLTVVGNVVENAGPEYIGTQLTKMGASVSTKVFTADCQPWTVVQERLLSMHHMLPLPALEYQYFERGLAPVVTFGLHLDP